MPRRLTILDVGHGNSAVLEDTKGVLIIDAGPKSGLLEYLTEQEITKINVVLLSHADQDHIAGLINLLNSDLFEIGRIRINSDELKDSAIWGDLLYELDLAREAGDVDFEPSLTPDDSGEFDQGTVHIEILGPSSDLVEKGPGSKDDKGRRIGTNSISAIIRLSQKMKPIALLPGDLDEIGLDDLIEHNIDASAPLLVFPHHGLKAGRTTAMDEFTHRLCEIVRPSNVIFSIGRGRNAPIPEVVAAIREHVPDVRIACTQLSEHCAFSLPQKAPSHLNDVFSKGREHQKCCAGTMVIDLDNPEYILPIYDAHKAFIENAAPNALCLK